MFCRLFQFKTTHTRLDMKPRELERDSVERIAPMVTKQVLWTVIRNHGLWQDPFNPYRYSAVTNYLPPESIDPYFWKQRNPVFNTMYVGEPSDERDETTSEIWIWSRSVLTTSSPYLVTTAIHTENAIDKYPQLMKLSCSHTDRHTVSIA